MKNVSLFFSGKFHILIQMKRICLFYKYFFLRNRKKYSLKKKKSVYELSINNAFV